MGKMKDLCSVQKKTRLYYGRDIRVKKYGFSNNSRIMGKLQVHEERVNEI